MGRRDLTDLTFKPAVLGRLAARNLRTSQVLLAVAHGRPYPLPTGDILYHMDDYAVGLAALRGVSARAAWAIAAVVDPSSACVLTAYRCEPEHSADFWSAADGPPGAALAPRRRGVQPPPLRRPLAHRTISSHTA